VEGIPGKADQLIDDFHHFLRVVSWFPVGNADAISVQKIVLVVLSIIDSSHFVLDATTGSSAGCLRVLQNGIFDDFLQMVVHKLHDSKPLREGYVIETLKHGLHV